MTSVNHQLLLHAGGGHRGFVPPMRRLVKPAGRFCVDILEGQNDRVLSGYREYGGLDVSSR